MKVLIQHNWTTGLGDLYCACTEYLNFIKPLKEIGYETELIFSFNGVCNMNKFIGMNQFEKIFNIDSFYLFDWISVREFPITNLTYNGMKYYHTQYGPTSPGYHWWDVYFDTPPENLEYPNMCPRSFLHKSLNIQLLPFFNDEVYSRSKNFISKINKEYDFIQIRYYDYPKTIDSKFDRDMNDLYEKIQKSEKIFHIGSNSPFVNNKFSSLKNVITYKFKNLNLFNNDHSYYYYNRDISNDLLLDRLYDNLAEMVSISNSQKIYLYSSFNWISNFLFCAFVSQGNNLCFKEITHNINELDH